MKTAASPMVHPGRGSNAATLTGLVAVVLWTTSVGLIRSVSELLGPTGGTAMVFTTGGMLASLVPGAPRPSVFHRVYLMVGGAALGPHQAVRRWHERDPAVPARHRGGPVGPVCGEPGACAAFHRRRRGAGRAARRHHGHGLFMLEPWDPAWQPDPARRGLLLHTRVVHPAGQRLAEHRADGRVLAGCRDITLGSLVCWWSTRARPRSTRG